MVSSQLFVLFTGGAMLAGASSFATAQDWGGQLPRNGACFYEDTNYRGRYFCVETGDERSTMPSGANDRVSSIRLRGSAEVTIYEDTRFRGDSLDLRSSVRDLDDEDFDDEISSIKVHSRSGRRRNQNNRSFNGNPDTVVRRAYQDILERDPDPAGLRLYRSRIIDDGWTEQQVREALRNSPEFRQRNTMTRARAQEVVRAAYLAVLGREPDPASRNYVDRVFRDNWTQADVERELRRSDEYRNRNR